VVDDDGVATDVKPPEVIKKTPKPAIGRAVHYVSYGTPGREYSKCCRAATITDIGGWRTTSTQQEDETHRILHQKWDPDMMGLVVHNPTGTFNNTTVPYDSGEPGTEDPQMCHGLEHPGGSWHWPELRW
jgi:hypothetical protein